MTRRRDQPRRGIVRPLGEHRGSSTARNACGGIYYYIDSRGREHFNFPEQLCLDPSVAMAATALVSIEPLAINLQPLRRQRDYRAALGVAYKRVRTLASWFVRSA
jgi:hypothetical protein